MSMIVTGRAHCDQAGCNVTWPRDPVLEVECPDCRARVGVRCRRPSGHAGRFTALHVARDNLADAWGTNGRCPLALCGVFSKSNQSSFDF